MRDKTGRPVSLWLGNNLCFENGGLSKELSFEKVSKMPSFSIASCSNGAEIHSMELLYFTGKTNWFREAVRPLKPYKNEDKHILQETGRGEGGNTDI